MTWPRWSCGREPSVAAAGVRASDGGRRGRGIAWVIALLMLIHIVLLGWMAYRDSPTWDEVGHFAAGVSHWRSGAFHLYAVNPPLVRSVACAPVTLLMNPVLDSGPYEYIADSQIRSEFMAGGKCY